MIISENSFRLMVEKVEDYAIFILSTDGTVISWNLGAERLEGYRAEEIIGQHFSRLYPEEDIRAGKPQRELEIATARGRLQNEGWRLRKDGSRFWTNVIITALRDGDGNLQGFGKVIRNVRNVTESNLAEQVRVQAELLRLSDDAIFQRKPDGRIETWNRGAERLYGFTAEEACGCCSHELLQTRFPQPLQEIETIVRKEGKWEGDLVHTAKDGRIVTVSAKFQLILGEDGVERLLEANRDITESRRLAAEAFQHATEGLALKESDRRKNEFLALLGHELRNPLAPIVTAVNILKQRGDGQYEKILDIIDRQVLHLVRLVDDLLDVSRITSGKIQLKKRLIRLEDAVAQGAEIAMPLIEQRRHHLDVRLPPSVLRLNGDESRLAQVVANLLTNSAKYTDPGGYITVEAHRQGNEIVLIVRDTGIGIAPELLPHVFDPFTQERQNVDRARGGLGIGLTIVRNFIELHGGTVQAESAGRGKGSAFTIRLPAATQEPAAIEFTPTAPLVRTSRRVLVVDDNEDALDLLAEVLRGAGHVVMTAKDGPSALMDMRAFHADIAILDIGLPVMDGYELAGWIRHEFGEAAPRLIALTGYGQDSDRTRTKQAGFAEHLTKPVDIGCLLGALDATSSAENTRMDHR